MNSGTPERWTVPVPLMAPVLLRFHFALTNIVNISPDYFERCCIILFEYYHFWFSKMFFLLFPKFVCRNRVACLLNFAWNDLLWILPYCQELWYGVHILFDTFHFSCWRVMELDVVYLAHIPQLFNFYFYFFFFQWFPNSTICIWNCTLL